MVVTSVLHHNDMTLYLNIIRLFVLLIYTVNIKSVSRGLLMFAMVTVYS